MKPRVGATILSLSNAILAVSELLTEGQEIHGGEWEGGRLSSPNCIEECNDSMMRHFLADEDVAVAANALIRLERRIRDERHAIDQGQTTKKPAKPSA